MNDRLRTGSWLVGRVIGALVLFCLVVAVAGYAVGPDPSVQSAPTVDVEERPGAAVVADAAAQLHVRDHTYQVRYQDRNRTSGDVRRGVLWRTRVDHSRDRYRTTAWRVPSEPNETVTSEDEPQMHGFANRYAVWVNWTEDANGWTRHVAASEPVYREKTAAPVRFEDRLRDASMSVVAENETALVVRSSDDRVRKELVAGSAPPNATVTFVVAKTDRPYLSRITLEYRRSSNEEVTVITRVSDVGNTTASRPDALAPTTPTEIVRRTKMGVKALVE